MVKAGDDYNYNEQPSLISLAVVGGSFFCAVDNFGRAVTEWEASSLVHFTIHEHSEDDQVWEHKVSSHK
jgi:hypothetical protein